MNSKIIIKFWVFFDAFFQVVVSHCESPDSRSDIFTVLLFLELFYRVISELILLRTCEKKIFNSPKNSMKWLKMIHWWVTIPVEMNKELNWYKFTNWHFKPNSIQNAKNAWVYNLSAANSWLFKIISLGDNLNQFKEKHLEGGKWFCQKWAKYGFLGYLPNPLPSCQIISCRWSIKN